MGIGFMNDCSDTPVPNVKEQTVDGQYQATRTRA